MLTVESHRAEVRRRLLNWWVPLLVWLTGTLVFYRRSFSSGFDVLQGNDGDGRLIVYLHEHWVRTLRGMESWRDLPIFYPAKGTLGYSDTFVLNEVIYAPLRFLGLDRYLAFQWTIIGIGALGFFSSFLLLRRHLELGAILSAGLSYVAIFSNHLYIKAGHPQLYAVHWVPVVLLATLTAWHDASRWRWAKLGASGALMGLLFLSTYYVAWISFLIAALSSLFLAVQAVTTRGIRAVGALTMGILRRGAPWILGFLVGMIPFIAVYLPVLSNVGGRRFEDTKYFAPAPGDLLNVGADNWLWGDAIGKWMNDPARMQDGERSLAMTPILSLALLVAVAVALHAVMRSRRFRHDRLAASLGLGTVLLAFLPLRFGDFTGWWAVWHSVPGAVGIRAVFRTQIVGGLAAVGVLGIVIAGAQRRLSLPQRRRYSLAIGVLLVVCGVEQINNAPNFAIDRSNETLSGLNLSPAPSSCQVFYVITDAAHRSWYAASIDAMIISQLTGLPTLNGYSGQLPPSYGASDPTAPNYQAAISEWVATQRITERICSFDLTTRSWSEPQGATGDGP